MHDASRTFVCSTPVLLSRCGCSWRNSARMARTSADAGISAGAQQVGKSIYLASGRRLIHRPSAVSVCVRLFGNFNANMLGLCQISCKWVTNVRPRRRTLPRRVHVGVEAFCLSVRSPAEVVISRIDDPGQLSLPQRPFIVDNLDLCESMSHGSTSRGRPGARARARR